MIFNEANRLQTECSRNIGLSEYILSIPRELGIP